MKELFLETTTEGELATQNWAEKFASQLQPGDVVFLEGNLGAGKTVITRGVCKGLGFTGSTHSPTYALVHEYEHQPPIYHIDLYRLPEGADFEEIGIEYYAFSEGVTLIEWPERLGGIDLDITWHIFLEHVDENTRNIKVYKLDSQNS